MSAYKEGLKKRIAEVQERIEKAASRSGRSGGDIQLMAVSKTRSYEEIMAAFELGLSLFGENRVQEAEEKFSAPLPEGMELHMIGHLQSNKVKKILPLVTCIQSVDSEKVAKEISKRALAFDKDVEIFLELNSSGEESKSGFADYKALEKSLASIIELPRIIPRGLMTIGPLGGDEKAVRRAFSDLREAKAKLEKSFPRIKLTELSMGMSGDYEMAIEEGATMVRIGTLLFGERP
jgi:PLP dependent protein